MTYSPVLSIFDPDKPTVLTTDLSVEGMVWILMHPTNNPEPHWSVKLLHKTGECLFDLRKKGYQLRPLAFGSWSCTDFEKKNNSFVWETECNKWAIDQNIHLFWGHYFWWLCDCEKIKEIIKYEGIILMIFHWYKEFLCYHFSIVHWTKKTTQTSMLWLRHSENLFHNTV